MIPHCHICARDASHVPIFWVRNGNIDVCNDCLLLAKGLGMPQLPTCASCGKRATMANAGTGESDYYCDAPVCANARTRQYTARRRQAWAYGGT